VENTRLKGQLFLMAGLERRIISVQKTARLRRKSGDMGLMADIARVALPERC
jgi:hypothetical protein